MRLRLIGLILLSYFMLAALSQAALPPPIVAFDATTITLAEGSKPATIPNNGFLGGTFNTWSAYGADTPVFGTVAGKKALTFNMFNGFTLDKVSTPGMGGQGPWTVSTWIYSPAGSYPVNGEFFEWARAGLTSQQAVLGYGTNTGYGAANHGSGSNMGYTTGFTVAGTVPPTANVGRSYFMPIPGQWHHITFTYAGGANGLETVYVDGYAYNQFQRTLSINIGCPIRIGYTFDGQSTSGGRNFAGSINSIYFYAGYCQTATEILKADVPNIASLYPSAYAPSFENPTYSTNRDGQSVLDGWAGSGYSQGNSKIGYVHQFNTNMHDNGLMVDGAQALMIQADGRYPASAMRLISQDLWNVHGNKPAHIWAWANRRSNNSSSAITFEARLNNVVVAAKTIAGNPAANYGTLGYQVEASKNWTKPFLRYEWTATPATTGSLNLAFGNNNPASDATLILDKVGFAEDGSPAVLTVLPSWSPNHPYNPTNIVADFGYGQPNPSHLPALDANTTLTITNDGGSDFNMTAANFSITGPDAANYSVDYYPSKVPAYNVASNNTGYKSAYNGTSGIYFIQLRFSPATVGTFNNATLNIINPDPLGQGTISIPLKGQSVNAPAIVNPTFDNNPNNASLYGAIATDGWDFRKIQDGITGAGCLALQNNNSNYIFNNGVGKGNYSQALFIGKPATAGTTETVTQKVYGFYSGHRYRFSMLANAGAGNNNGNNGNKNAKVQVKIGGLGVPFTSILTTVSANTANASITAGIGNTNNLGGFNKGTGTGNFKTKFEGAYTATVDGPQIIQLNCPNTGTDTGILLDELSIYDAGSPVPNIDNYVLNYGTVGQTFVSDPQTVTMTNTGGTTLTWSAAVTGGDADQFQLQTLTFPVVAPMTGSTTINVAFAPTTVGTKNSTLQITTNFGSFTVQLTGICQVLAPTPTPIPSPVPMAGALKIVVVGDNDVVDMPFVGFIQSVYGTGASVEYTKGYYKGTTDATKLAHLNNVDLIFISPSCSSGDYGNSTAKDEFWNKNLTTKLIVTGPNFTRNGSPGYWNWINQGSGSANGSNTKYISVVDSTDPLFSGIFVPPDSMLLQVFNTPTLVKTITNDWTNNNGKLIAKSNLTANNPMIARWTATTSVYPFFVGGPYFAVNDRLFLGIFDSSGGNQFPLLSSDGLWLLHNAFTTMLPIPIGATGTMVHPPTGNAFINNPSFEVDKVTMWTSNNPKATITAWTDAGLRANRSNIGLINMTGWYYPTSISGALWDNGTNVDGSQVAWIQKGGLPADNKTANLIGNVYNISPNQAYQFTLAANATATTTQAWGPTYSQVQGSGFANVALQVANTTVISTRTVNAVDPTNVFSHQFPTFTGIYSTCTLSNLPVRILIGPDGASGSTGTTDTLLVDNIAVTTVSAKIIGADPYPVTFSEWNNTWNPADGNQPGTTATVTIKATSTQAVTLNGGDGIHPGLQIIGPAASEYSLNCSNASTTVNPGASFPAVIGFNPGVPGTITQGVHQAYLRITSDDQFKSTFDVPLNGTVTSHTAQRVAAVPNPVEFAPVCIKTLASHRPQVQYLKISNPGGSTLHFVGGADYTGLAIHSPITSVTQAFSILSFSPSKKSYLLPGESMIVKLQYFAAMGTYDRDEHAWLSLTTDDATNPDMEIPLNGYARMILPPIADPETPDGSISYGQAYPIQLPDVNAQWPVPPTSTTLMVRIKNVGDLPLTCTQFMTADDGHTSIPKVTLTGPGIGSFKILKDAAHITTSVPSANSVFTLASGKYLDVWMSFYPNPMPTPIPSTMASAPAVPFGGDANVNILFESNDFSSPLTTPVQGNAVFKWVQKMGCNPTTVTFVDVNRLWGPQFTTSSLVIYNRGDLPLVLSGGTTYTLPGLALTTTTNFQILSMTPVTTPTLSLNGKGTPGFWTRVVFRFKPDAAITHRTDNINTTLTITSNDPIYDPTFTGLGVPNATYRPRFIVLKANVTSLTQPKLVTRVTSMTFGTVTPNATTGDPTKNKIRMTMIFDNTGESTLTMTGGTTPATLAGLALNGGVGTSNFKIISEATDSPGTVWANNLNILGHGVTTVTLDYDPTTANPLIIPRNENTDLKLTSNDPTGDKTVHLNAFYNNYMPRLVADWPAVMFPWVNVEGTALPTANTLPTTKTITLTNIGQLPFTFATLTGNVVTGLSLMGSNYTDFKILSVNDAAPANLTTLAAGASVKVTIQFKPFGHYHRFGLLGRLYVNGFSGTNSGTSYNDPYGNVTVLLNADAVPVTISHINAE